MAQKHHRIDIIETDETITATILNVVTDKTLTISYNLADWPDYGEMIGELFGGGLPNIRGCYDSDTWVNKPRSGVVCCDCGIALTEETVVRTLILGSNIHQCQECYNECVS